MAVHQTNIPLQRPRARAAMPTPRVMLRHELALLAGAVIIVCLLSVLYLAQTGRVAAAGHTLQELQAEHVELVHNGEQSEYRIAKASRLDVVAERAARLGLRTATSDQLRYATIPVPAVPMVASSPER